MASFGLPPTPAPLKSIAPYLQRADELHQKEPIIAYWCAYYAAQVGISLKAKDTASRTLLLQLLDLLEKMKQDIGSNDAIDMEAASAAYVENFALKIFGVADDEDRRGESTRSTAKKFLAAANFLEVLKTFPKAELTVSTEEKIRYAKWKAADIAKAFREGRKPTPGAAGEHSSPQLELPPAPSGGANISGISPENSQTSPSSSKSASPSRLSPPAIKRSSPPPILDELPSPQPFTPPRNLLGINPANIDPISPGNWSTAATPGAGTAQGTPTDDSPLRTDWLPESPTPGARHKPRSGSQSSADSVDSQQSFGSPESRRRKTSISPKKVHFSATAKSGPLPTPDTVPSAPEWSTLPPPPIHPPSFQAPVPPNNYVPTQPTLPSATSYNAHPHPSPPAPASIMPQQVELNPSVIAKAQKHCRFAISALDYEDAEQAKKELRAALAILGG
ncbi:hypothetical protein GYMLUDRAFT_32731 [Collybiopsis luxurians FD-317 M1]|nr:hypothetical protein GYMLUDRAFT_32731 [Collybiopsis luxurians FD-317 M1]